MMSRSGTPAGRERKLSPYAPIVPPGDIRAEKSPAANKPSMVWPAAGYPLTVRRERLLPPGVSRAVGSGVPALEGAQDSTYRSLPHLGLVTLVVHLAGAAASLGLIADRVVELCAARAVCPEPRSSPEAMRPEQEACPPAG